MSRWGVRWIFCWLSVLVTTACGQFSSPTPTQESTEQIPTLQNFIPPSTASPNVTIKPISTITPQREATAFRIATVSPDPDIFAEAPECYVSALDSIICLGWIQNNSNNAITNPIINFYLLTPQGEIISAQEVIPALTYITSKEGTAYRAVFSDVPNDNWIPYASVRIVEDRSRYQNISSIRLNELSTTWDGEQYLVSGVINNLNATRRVRVVASIRNEQGKITGYRILDFDVNNRDEIPIELEIAPLDNQQGDVTLQYQGYVN